MDYIIMAISGVSVLVGIIMIFAFIATKNAVIDIVTSFETQNSNSYEIRLKVFNRAINYLSNLEEKNIDEMTKKKELGEVFDNLLMVSNYKETLATFEDVVQSYFTSEVVDLKKLLNFKACVRMEFGAKKYNSKIVYKYSVPTGKFGFGLLEDRPSMPPRQMMEGMPNGARVNMPPKAPIPNSNMPHTGATFVTTKTQNETMANIGQNSPLPNGLANNNMPPRPMPNGIVPPPRPNGVPPQTNTVLTPNIIMPKTTQNSDNNKK